MILDLMNKEGRKENSIPKKRERELYSRLKRRSKLSTNLVSSQNESNRKSTRTRRNWNSYLPPAPTPISDYIMSMYAKICSIWTQVQTKLMFLQNSSVQSQFKSRSQTPPSPSVHNGPKSNFYTFFLSCTTISNMLKFQKKLEGKNLKILWNCRFEKNYKNS